MNPNDTCAGSEHDQLPDPLLASTVDARYRIIEKIGQGGMSTVYQAEHLMMNRLVALKILTPKSASNPVVVKRFMREAVATSKLKHPNVVEVIGCGVWNGLPYLVMDFLDGRTLAQVIRLEGCLTVERARPVFVQICDALGAAHALGIVHRDLKPSNVVLLEGDKKVKLVDFGIAAVISDENLQKLTQTGDIFGTIQYMSPEQCMGKSVDARSDIYSLGCLMYESLTGVPPFVGDSAFSVVSQQLNDAPRSDVRLGELEPVIMRCLCKNGDDRPSTTEELRRMLLAPNMVSHAHPALKSKRKRRFGIFIAAVAVLLVIALSISIASRKSNSVPLSKPESPSSIASESDEIERAIVLSQLHDKNTIPALTKVVDKAHSRTTQQIMNAESRLASALQWAGNYRAAVKYAHEVAENGLPSSDPTKNAYGFDSLRVEGESYEGMHNHDKARAAFSRLAQEAEKIENEKYLAYSYFKFATLANEEANFDSGLSYSEKALALGCDRPVFYAAQYQLALACAGKVGLTADISKRRKLWNKSMSAASIALKMKGDKEIGHVGKAAEELIEKLNSDPAYSIHGSVQPRGSGQ